MTPSPSRFDLPRIQTLAPVDLKLPEDFSRLSELAYNLWWSWTPEARIFFSSINPGLWARYRSPIHLLLETGPQQWESLRSSEVFRSSYERIMGAFDRYMTKPEQWWFSRQHPDYHAGAFAYLSTEYGIHECLGLYSGGLGVLSGDHCKSASDRGLPLVAVGLLYRRGYFRQTIDAEGRQQHFYPDFDLSVLPMQPVLSRDGHPLIISVPLLDRTVRLAVYKVQVGRIPLLLLDSDVSQNEPQDRPITHILYVRGREMRLCQEMLLGVGAVRALRALEIHPAVWHLNEGHSALMVFELIREELGRGETFQRAIERIKKNLVFTTHTPVPAGNERFTPNLARLYLGSWAVQFGVPVSDLMALGRVKRDDEKESFNLTALALRCSSFRNAVSKKHGEVSRDMWRSLFKNEDPPIASITNGVHVDSFLGLELRELFERRVGIDWQEDLDDRKRWGRLDELLPDDELWAAHNAQKRRLIRVCRDRLRRMYARHGASPRELMAVSKILEPRALTIGFGRRFATYKRAGLLFRDVKRIKKIVRDEARPVQFVFAGKAHPADLEGQSLITDLFRHAQSEDFKGRVVFLEDYDLRIGRILVEGVDVWLNNPRRPLEASGTSGQKAAVNGALNLSVLDGWWIEGYAPEVGWAIGGQEASQDEAKQDEDDAQALYRLLEDEVVPLYYERDADDLPREWIRRSKCAIRNLLPRFCGSRMVREYAERAYLPLTVNDRD
ncbi:MAG: alpha-glucan family phosphorylase [Acidobacteriota bacterium]|nr:MAG: alpha-glucan family phosphorylase [Acidobacteriota bacterium]